MAQRSAPAPFLRAYVLNPDMVLPLVLAPADREWMTATPGRFAYQCLPLVMANQSGWLLLSGHAFTACWDGTESARGLTIEYLLGDSPYPATSHFGSGIITWTLPYLFRTPPGWNLLLRGPANHIKDGAQALEGLVETDWNPATATLNWKLTRPNYAVTFAQNEPIGMLVPQRRDELEAFQPALCPIEADAELAQTFSAWANARTRFLMEAQMPGTVAAQQRWQQDYRRGEYPDGTRAPQHQTKRRLRSFARLSALAPGG